MPRDPIDPNKPTYASGQFPIRAGSGDSIRMALDPRLLALSYLAVTLLPLALAWLGARPPRSIWDELASGAGMLAFSVILVEFMLSGRFRTISGRIGMDVTMRFHQLFARLAVILALIHPFLYRAPFSPALPWDTTRQLTLTTDSTALTTGLFAWILLPVLVLLGIGRATLDFSYEIWRLLHGIGALLVAGLLLHHALYAGRYSEDPVLAGIWIAMFAIALLTLAQVYLFRPLRQLRKPWTVKSVRPAGLKTWDVNIAPDRHEGLRFEAGQFAWLNIGRSPFLLAENPFSIASAPASADRVQFLIKELGDFTGSLGGIEPGTKAYLDGPHGNLTIAGRDEPGIALIAGGVGIAPLLSILRQLHHDGDRRPTALVYGNRVEEQIVCREELASLALKHGTEMAYVLSEPPKDWAGHRGMIDPELIRALFGNDDKHNWLYVLCGPTEMMISVEDTLIDLGVPAGQILSERFQYD
jgi:predicted ferric reductase